MSPRHPSPTRRSTAIPYPRGSDMTRTASHVTSTAPFDPLGVSAGLTLRLTLFFALLACLAPGPLEAQAGARTFVAIPDAFPPIEARAMVVREPGIDLVLLRDSEATLDALTMALHVLRDARERDPSPAQGQMLPITGFVMLRPAEGPIRAKLQAVLARLANARSVDLGSLGTGRRVALRGR